MSTEALAVVRPYCDLLVAGDFDGAEEYVDPEVVWFGTPGGLDQNRIHRGREAVREYTDEIWEAWERLDVEVEQMIEAGNAVVVFFRELAQSRHGGPEMQSETAAVFRVRHGKIFEIRGYLDRDEALRAARAAE
jgi:ketosteroid isomerase-like protein